MRAYRSAVLAVVAFAAGALPAWSQDASTVEVTPYVAVGSAAASPVGAALTLPITATFSAEADVAYRRGEGDRHALSSSVGLLYFLPHVSLARPYIAGGIGLAQYGTPLLSPGGHPVGTQPRLGLTVNAGGGLKMPMSETLDWRTDARWFKSFGPHGSEQFRVAQGISFDIGKR